MNQAQPQNLDKALEHLTLCLEDPCVPGELEGWTKAVWQALEGVRPVLQNHFAVNHQEHFARITEEDSEMFRQVTLLKKEDRNILQHFESLADLTKNRKLPFVPGFKKLFCVIGVWRINLETE